MKSKLFEKLLISFSALLIFFSLNLLNSQQVKAVPIGPDKYFFNLEENETRNEKLILYGRENLEEVQTVYLYVVGMKKVGEEDLREFFFIDPNDRKEVGNWISLSKNEVELKKGDVLNIDWSIKNEGVAPCGTNLAAIVAASAPPDNVVNGAKVNFKNQVVAQVHVDITKVNGRDCEGLKPNLSLLDFKVDSPWIIFDHQNIPFLTRIENSGAVISRSPKGFIEIFQGKDKVGTIEFNPTGLDIYPETIRRFTNEWKDPNFPENGNFFEQLIYDIANFKFGYYEARLGVTKNATPTIVATTNFWIIPWRIILTLLVIISAIIIYVMIRKRRNRIHSQQQIIR